ncbi:FAD binding domain-containing protein [Ferrovibrio sp.]|uniref:FAD binding domain-containing protein n=1 Tax=Ferrovibrio sp. TaxID=1917215 RepID=UPI003D134AE7
MLPRRFNLHRPRSLSEVFGLLDQYGDDASVYAGGTELLIALKARVLHYPHLIDLKALSELAAIEEYDGDVVIGALASHHRIATHPLVRGVVPAYADLSDGIANIRVRCAGTLGGNLCFAEPHADPPAMLAALGARVRLHSKEGQRDCAVADFILGDFETARQPGEVMTAILIPKPAPELKAAYRCYGAGERPAAGAAVAILPDAAGNVAAAQFWIGAVSGQPAALTATMAAAGGKPLGELAEACLAVAADEIAAIAASDDSHGSADYKRHLALTMLERALAAALGGEARAERMRA